MRRFAAMLLVLTAGLVFGAGDSKDDAKKDLDQMQGTWRRTSAQMNGQSLPEEALKNTTLTIKGDEYTLEEKGGETRKGTFKLDPSKSPKQIDLMPAEGPNKGKTLPGIYELDGDTLRYCINLQGKDRPTEFASKQGSGNALFGNKRAKP
jgi:uncharacterized protein (TIGR03067 family)